jgi:aarF domain-containing kinase
MEGGDVSLLDCGQVKELNNEQRSALSTLVVSVNEWENINNRVQKLESKFGAMSAAARTPLDAKPSNSTSSDGMSTDLKRAKDELLTKTIQLGSQVLSAGVKLNPGVGIECAAAIAILLFGNSDTKLPGGYAGAEISEDSPIAQVLDFPSEFILLGRATVMIKGIAGRVGIPWSLSTIWASYAKDAIAASAVATEMLPIWSVVPPTITVNKNAFTAPKFSVLGKTEAGVGAERKDSQVSADTSVAGGNRVRFAEVLFSLAGTIELLKDYLIKKGMHLVTKYVPESIRKRALKVVLPIVERYQANGERDVASA